MPVKINLLPGARKIPSRPGWLDGHDFRFARMESDRTNSAYMRNLAKQFLERDFKKGSHEVSQALILGMGRNFDEVSLLADHFRGMREICIVEWDPWKVTDIRQRFARDASRERIKVLCEDARSMRRVADSKVDLVYFSSLLDLHLGNSDDLRILSEVGRVLRPHGHAFSLDLLIYRKRERGHLEAVGLERVRDEVYRKKAQPENT